MTTTMFAEFLRVLVAFISVYGRNISLFMDNCAAHQQIISFPLNVKFMHYS